MSISSTRIDGMEYELPISILENLLVQLNNSVSGLGIQYTEQEGVIISCQATLTRIAHEEISIIFEDLPIDHLETLINECRQEIDFLSEEIIFLNEENAYLCKFDQCREIFRSIISMIYRLDPITSATTNTKNPALETCKRRAKVELIMSLATIQLTLCKSSVS